MNKLEFLAILYSLDKMHAKGNHEDAHDVIKKLIRQAEGIKEKPQQEE